MSHTPDVDYLRGVSETHHTPACLDCGTEFARVDPDDELCAACIGRLRGVSETLAEIRRQMGGSNDGGPTFPGFERMLRDAAAELGLDEDAPSGRTGTPQTAVRPSGAPEVANGGPEAPGGPQGVERCIGLCAGCAPDCRLVGDSCSCTIARPDPGCVVHHGRRAKGPKPPNPPGCICDGSGRTCPRHGAVI